MEERNIHFPTLSPPSSDAQCLCLALKSFFKHPVQASPIGPPPPSLRPCSLIIEMATVSYELERLEPRLMSAQNDSRCHGRQSECVSDDVWLPNTDKVNLFLF